MTIKQTVYKHCKSFFEHLVTHLRILLAIHFKSHDTASKIIPEMNQYIIIYRKHHESTPLNPESWDAVYKW